MKHKSMYCMNLVVIVDHFGYIIYVDGGFPGSFHDSRCLRNSDINKNCRQYFTSADLDQVGEYVLGDPGYLGLDMYILRRVDFGEIAREEQTPIIEAFNRRHCNKRVKVDWGIGGVKNKWRRFLDVCPSRRRNFEPVFVACCRLTNFIHDARQDFRILDEGPATDEEVDTPGVLPEWGFDPL
jgi:hypothetical protein